jgi:glycosyltransferase involved in cell wall biosynthesis
MKIAMVVPCYLPIPEGGAERQCRLQAGALIRRGHEVTVYTRRWSRAVPRVEVMEGVRVVRLGGFLPVEEWCWKMRRRITGKGKGEYLAGPTTDQVRMGQATLPRRRIRVMEMLAWIGEAVYALEWRWHFRKRTAYPDVVHVHANTWEGALCAISGNRWGVPVFIKPTLSPLQLDFRPVPGMGRGQKKGLGEVLYFALSAEIHEALNASGVGETRIVDLPNGVEMPGAISPMGRKPVVLMVGNLTQGGYHKAFDVMLEAWSRIVQTDPETILQIAGAGDPTPWETMADQLGGAANIRFLGRVESVAPLYDEAQVFCLPSREEGLSNALLEAQSHGIACVVSDIQANRVVVKDGENGLIVPVGDASALASAVSSLLADAALREKLGKASTRRVEGEFEIEAVVKRLERAYKRALFKG